MEHLEIKHFNVATIHGKRSQNEKKMRQYVSLKDVIQNSFGLACRELWDVSLYSDTTCRVRLLWQKKWPQATGFTVLYLSILSARSHLPQCPVSFVKHLV